MYGPHISKNDWTLLGIVLMTGLAVFVLIWLLGPPALITLLSWLIAPRMGWDHFNYLHFYGVSFTIWLGLHIVSVALATWPLWNFWRRK